MAAVHKWLTNTAPSVRRALSQKSKAGWVGSIGAYYPSKRQATLARMKEANDDQGARDDAAQRSPRHGVSELGAEPGAAAQTCREDDAKTKSSLP